MDFFKLVEALLQINSCFLHSIKMRGLPLSTVTLSLQYICQDVRFSIVTCGKCLLASLEVNL